MFVWTDEIFVEGSKNQWLKMAQTTDNYFLITVKIRIPGFWLWLSIVIYSPLWVPVSLSPLIKTMQSQSY